MRGVTLVEMAVVLVLLGLVSTVAGLALGRLGPTPDGLRAHHLEEARARAIHLEEPVIFVDNGGHLVRFLPDGRAIGIGVNPVTGHAADATR